MSMIRSSGFRRIINKFKLNYKEENSDMNFYIVASLLVIVVGIIVIVAMKSGYSVRFGLKFSTCKFKCDIKPNDIYSNKSNHTSTSRLSGKKQ